MDDTPSKLEFMAPYRKWPRLQLESLEVQYYDIFVIYVNDWADNLTLDHLLYANHFKHIASSSHDEMP